MRVDEDHIVENVLKHYGTNTLEHFGVKGMRWGHRQVEDISNSQPSHPKQLSDRKLRKISKHEEEARQIQKIINETNAKPKTGNFYVDLHRKEYTKELERHRDQNLKDAQAIKEGHLTSKEKKVLIGAGVTAGVIAAYGSYKLVDSGVATQYFNRNTAFKTNDLLSRKMSADDIMEHVVKDINPGYGGIGTKVNCRRCTFAYEMRRRGFDVKSTRTTSGFGQNIAGELRATNPGSKFHTSKPGVIYDLTKEELAHPGGTKKGPLSSAAKVSNWGRNPITMPKTFNAFGTTITRSGEKRGSDAIFEALAKQPNGARGELGMGYHRGGGHSVAWEIIDGKPHIFDTQAGIVYKNADDFADFGSRVKDAAFTRLDNIDLNEEYLGRWVHNVK